MKSLSKSRYTAFCQCPKNLWLGVFKRDEAVIDDAAKARFEEGNVVGDLAMGLFGNYKEAHAEKPDGSLDLSAMIAQTQQFMAAGVENICEASFSIDGNYCAVDILRKNGDGWDIYEVKSSTYHDDKTDTAKHLLVYSRDIAYQKWVLERCGVKVKGCYLVRLDSNYVRGKELDIQELFHVKDMKELVDNEFLKVPTNVKRAKAVLAGDEPDEPVALHCHDPYDCAFFQYCTKGMQYPNVFNMYRMDFRKKCDLYNQGKIYYEDLRNEELTEIQRIQVETSLNGTQLVTPEDIREFLKKLTYPLYFLDFETMQQAIPEYEGTKPYQQVTFQYSLHWIEEEGGELKHSEFLGDSVHDPRRALAEQLCKDIPKGVCTTAYNKGFECGRLKELANAYPDLRNHLLDIRDHIVDLIEPFRQKMVYLPEMNGSFSIKHVLPALQPDDPALNYSNLEGSVHNGGEAMTIYPLIATMTPSEAAAARESLLKYCWLDTYAMVKVWEKLQELAMNNHNSIKPQEYLKKSPMFRLSLSSKELFHSNFLEWLSTENRDAFRKLINSMAGLEEDTDWGENWSVKREFNNFDLCVVAYIDEDSSSQSKADSNFVYNDDDFNDDRVFHVLFVIENKVKSIPYREQLIKYAQKAEKINKKSSKSFPHGLTIATPRYILLTLAQTFPDKQEDPNKWKLSWYEKKGGKKVERDCEWKICSYDSYASLLKKYYSVDCQKDNPSNLIINDYFSFIKSLTQLSEIWAKDYQNDSPFLYWGKIDNDEKKYCDNFLIAKSLRIHDLYQKQKFSVLCTFLYKKIKETYTDITVFPSNQGGLFKDKFYKKDGDKLDKKSQYICVNYTYLHGEPLLEINFHPKCDNGTPDLYYTIQVQGDAYEHGVQVKRIPNVTYKQTEKGRGKGKDNIAKFVWDNVLQQNGDHPNVYHGIIEGWMKTPKSKWSDNCTFLSEKIVIEKDLEYNAYNMSDGAFLYQKRRIYENASIENIIQKMLADLKVVVEKVNKP